MAYVVYERKTIRTRDVGVTITSAGRVGFNAAATRLLHNNGVEAVLLMVDQERRKIAFKQISRKDKRAYMIAYGKDHSGASMTAKAFLDDIGWDGKKHNTAASWNEEQSLLEFEMPEWKKEGRSRLAAVDHSKRPAKAV